MPGIVAHMCVAKLVGEKLGINDSDFYLGNLLPDIIKGDKMDTHYKVQGKMFHVPDASAYLRTHSLEKSLEKGYYTHLLLDYYYMEEFLPSITNDREVFQNKIVYHDYDNSNASLIKKFHLDVDYLKSVLQTHDDDIDLKRLKKNLSCLDIRGNDSMKLFSIEEFESFIEDSSRRIISELSTKE